MSRTAILCVMRSGGDFNMNDVVSLYKMILEHTTISFDFICLTDMSGIYVHDDASQPFCTIPLLNTYKGWWAKIELFRSNLVSNERILYFDLDKVITQNIDDLLIQNEKFIGLKPFNNRNKRKKDFIASAIMGWVNDGSLSYIYDEFDYNQDAAEYAGDQDYINKKLQEKEIPICYWQDIVEGIFSYKRHIRNGIVKKKDARIICFHGDPRPKEIRL